MNEAQLIAEMCHYFDQEIVQKHQESLLIKHSRLSSYQTNPILLKYLSQLVDSGITEEGIAKALFYPRALGTSISGSFGSKFQKMLVDLKLVYGSLIPGMDIEYVDQIDNRQKYCQLKSGPNTINSKDVNPILNEFDSVANLARTNHSSQNLSNNDLVLGVIYGDRDQLSTHYTRIDQKYPVLIGAGFWHRVTGFPDFYNNLINSIDELISNMTQSNAFQTAYQHLLADVKSAGLI